ncbi:MAG: flagellar hook-basal body complex protein FliE [Lachnospiraceae bacterium]|nr:flagellar hook-basal body complex protein FliE [Lachnospiraceae bacterium]
MDVQIINGLKHVSDISWISGIKGVTPLRDTENIAPDGSVFDRLLESAKVMIKETNYYQNKAEEAELMYAMGLMTNTHDLQVAQQKANLSLQYTVAVRNAVIDAYKEIMQINF